MSSSIQNIPKSLIYEMVDGHPIYYHGYKDYLNGSKQLEEIMGSSYLQSLIITQVVIFMGSILSDQFQILTNEVGLQFSKNSWRSADIAIVEKSKIKTQKNLHQYLEFAPEVVVKIDTKASLDEINDSFGYFHKKTDQLIDFGVKKVIWIFTESCKIMIAQKEQPWQTINWEQPFEIMEKISVNLNELIDLQ